LASLLRLNTVSFRVLKLSSHCGPIAAHKTGNETMNLTPGPGPIAVAFILWLTTAVGALEAEQIDVVNKCTSGVTLWLWSSGAQAWAPDPLVLKPRQRAALLFSRDTRYYLVARRVPSQIDDVLGWVDIAALLDRAASPEIELADEQRIGTRTVTSMIWKPVTKSVTQTYTVMVPYNVGGVTMLRPETRSRTVDVSEQVAEQVPREEKYNHLGVGIGLYAENAPMTSAVTFKTEKVGATVRFQLVGRSDARWLANLTTATEKMPVGIYTVWTERSGAATSQRLDFDIFDEAMTITIPERAMPQ
jgi:hypothetical protein